ncbi:PREDICTED: piggyBac transposable element-derived protein 4-like [Diuraphis noxia]|uniref:piggyBac transposable element-derived protein 4-like n=1 Tax=Diuraphis noxia TaxID=143948 RepID=UPI0007637BD2|nr:PREDICTED: piggyBac transposable element-derived protein 4-like [Diuraphis noxia]
MKSPISDNIIQLTPLNIWEKIFSPFIDLNVRESYLYAEQSNNLLDTTPEKIKAFIGILIIMGFHSLPSIRHYWSNDKNFFCDRVASIMTVKRFLKHLSIDESVIAFKGRSGMKQYMPMKPIKRGFKVWALADSASGYLINFEIYTGKNSNNLTEFGLGEHLVESLV